MQLSLNRAAQSTIILFFFKVLIGQFLLSSLPTVTAQESAVPNCFACPESDAAGTPLDDMGTSRGAISCAYGSASCSYETNAGILIAGDSNCFDVAVDDCGLRRALRRARALPRAPKPPSPGAFAPKPEVMRVRANLRGQKANGKKVSREL